MMMMMMMQKLISKVNGEEAESRKADGAQIDDKIRAGGVNKDEKIDE